MHTFKLTKTGRRRATQYIRELEAKRKEILDSRLDTANDTHIPTIEDIEQDIDGKNWEYRESWGVTDNYDADSPLHLKYGTDFYIEDKEWETACNADEKKEYFRFQMYNGGTCIKQYKPSLAKLMAERSGLKYERVSS